MRKSTQNIHSSLIIIGVFIIALSQLLSFYFDFSDGVKGAFMGVGIGIMIVSLRNKKRKVQS